MSDTLLPILSAESGLTEKAFRDMARPVTVAPKDGDRILAIVENSEPVVVTWSNRLKGWVDRNQAAVVPHAGIPLWR